MKLLLDESAPVPLYQQVYQQIRELILQGELRPGRRLPPSRVLARQVGLGRVTVTTAYKQLVAEGYVRSQTGAGTFVADDLPLPDNAAAPPFSPPLSHWAQQLGPAISERDGGDEARPRIDFGLKSPILSSTATRRRIRR